MAIQIPGPPGTTYEASWGRRRASDRTFIGRLREYDANGEGGVILYDCGMLRPPHRHVTEAEAEKCAAAEGARIAAAAIGNWRDTVRAMAQMDTAEFRQQLCDELGVEGVEFR